MAKPILLQDRFTGIFKDKPRHQLPDGKVWGMTDFIPDEMDGPVRKRAGWVQYGSNLTAIDASAAAVNTVAVAPFSGGTQVVASDTRTNSELFDLTNSADRGSIYGANGIPMAPKVFYRELLLIPSPALAAAPVAPRKYVAAGTISALGGSPPWGSRYFAIHKGRLWASSADTDFPNRIYTAGSDTDAGDPETWNSARYHDASSPVIAMASLRSGMLLFQSGRVERLRGDVPAGSPAANMGIEPLFGDTGIIGPYALAVGDDYAYWADENGVYRTDGSSLTDLTKLGGISTWYRDYYNISPGAKVAVGIWRGYLWVSMTSSSDNFVKMFMFKIDTRDWFELSHIKTRHFALQSGATDELYFAASSIGEVRVGKMSGIFNEYGDTGWAEEDPGNAELQPVLQTKFFMFGWNKKRIRRAYMTYEITNDVDGPEFWFGTSVNITDTSSEQIGAFPRTGTSASDDKEVRARAAVNRYGRGLYLSASMIPTPGARSARIYSFEVEIADQEGSKLGEGISDEP